MGKGNALEGLLVVELSQLIAAPHAAQLLALQGADVLKIEPPEGDVSRRMGPSLPGGTSAMYLSFNRGKRTTVADLHYAADLSRIIELASAADVFITNHDALSLLRVGLDFASLAGRNAKLVYAEVSAFGSGGPLGTDGLAQAASGMASLTGPADGQAYRSGASVVDVSTGVWLAFGIMLALEERRRTGRGVLVRTSLMDVALGLTMNQLAMFSLDPVQIRRIGNHSMISCTPMFQASDGRFAVTLIHNRHWLQFCRALERPELIDDPRFRDDESRRIRQQELEAELDPMLCLQARAIWVERLRAVRVPVAPERTLAEVLADEDLRLRGMLYDEELPASAAVTLVGSPITFGRLSDVE